MREKRIENRVQANHNQKEHQPADKPKRKQNDCRDEHDYRDVVGQQHVDDVATTVVRVRDRLGRASCGVGVGAGHGAVAGRSAVAGRGVGVIAGRGIGAGRGAVAGRGVGADRGVGSGAGRGVGAGRGAVAGRRVLTG